jgi:hypothetical protein
MTWWKRDPRRLALEIALLTRAAGGRFCRSGDTILYDEEIVSDRVPFGLRVRFPEDYPASAPLPFLLYPDLPVTVEIHRYVGGALCVHGPDEWHPNECTGLWLRNRTAAWVYALSDFLRTGVWPLKMPIADRSRSPR